MVERLGRKTGFDRVAYAVVAAIDPGEDFEGLAGDEHIALADNGAARFVAYLGRDRVFVVGVAVQLFSEERVDLDVDRSFGTNFALDFGHHLRWRAIEVGPPYREG